MEKEKFHALEKEEEKGKETKTPWGKVRNVLEFKDSFTGNRVIYCCFFHPVGKKKHDIVLYSPGSEEYVVLQGHKKEILTVGKYSKNILYSYSYDQHIKLWHVDLGLCLDSHKIPFMALGISRMKYQDYFLLKIKGRILAWDIEHHCIDESINMASNIKNIVQLKENTLLVELDAFYFVIYKNDSMFLSSEKENLFGTSSTSTTTKTKNKDKEKKDNIRSEKGWTSVGPRYEIRHSESYCVGEPFFYMLEVRNGLLAYITLSNQDLSETWSTLHLFSIETFQLVHSIRLPTLNSPLVRVSNTRLAFICEKIDCNCDTKDLKNDGLKNTECRCQSSKQIYIIDIGVATERVVRISAIDIVSDVVKRTMRITPTKKEDLVLSDEWGYIQIIQREEMDEIDSTDIILETESESREKKKVDLANSGEKINTLENMVNHARDIHWDEEKSRLCLQIDNKTYIISVEGNDSTNQNSKNSIPHPKKKKKKNKSKKKGRRTK